MSTLTIKLDGPAIHGARVSAALLRSVLDTLVDAAQECVRLRAEGRSRAGGPIPAWLEQAAAFDVEIVEGSTQLLLNAAPLGDVAPERFSQPDLFEPVDPRRSCLDLLVDSIGHLVDGRLDSDLYDDRLIETLEGFGWAFRHGVATLQLANEGRLRMLDEGSVTSMQELRRQIPAERRVRVGGKLEILRHGSRTFAIQLESGDVVRGVVVGSQVDVDGLGPLWGGMVVAEGVAQFRPSGRILRLDAETITRAAGDVALWSQAPKPLTPELDVRALREPQGPRSGVAAIFGRWPGDEDEATLACGRTSD